MKHTLFHVIAMLLLLCLMATGCKDDENADRLRDHEVMITATVSPGSGVRAAAPAFDRLRIAGDDSCFLQVTESDAWPLEVDLPLTRASAWTLSTLQANGLGLYMYSGSTALTEDLKYIYASSAWKAYAEPAIWPGLGTVDFYAYAPCEAARLTAAGMLSGPGEQTAFTVEPVNADQVDLLLASATGVNGTGNTTVNLEFKHILTAVCFRAGEGLTGKVQRITFRGVADAGTYNASANQWTPSGTTADFTLAFADGPTVDGTGDITSADQYFLMMPQSLDGSAATLELEIGSETYTYSLSDSRAWNPGKLVTYTLKYNDLDDSEYEFTVSNDLNMDYTGDGANSFVVTSLKDGVSQSYQLEYLVSGSVEGGDAVWSTTKPSSATWLTLTQPGLSSLGLETVSATVSVALETNVTITPQTRNMEMATRTPLGTEAEPYDLSLVNVSTGVVAADISGRSTANCYVVQAPGWYMIPMVYGNAIKEGQTNSEVFTEAAVNHSKALITRPWLSEAGVQVASADMLWQDYSGLVTNLSVISVPEDGGLRQFIRFRVPVHTDRPTGYTADYVPQGNCLLAAKNASGDIVWSWHIWVTPEDLTEVSTAIATNPTTHAFVGSRIFAPIELGFCASDAIRVKCYPAHQTQLRLTQAGSNQQVVVNVNQHMHIDEVLAIDNGYAPYFQWGIKNPIPPSTGTSNECHALFKLDGTEMSTYPAIADYCFGQTGEMFKTVLNPLIIHAVAHEGGSMWANAGLMWSASYKTMNDPSPVGYRVPPKSAFSSIWPSGGSTKSSLPATKDDVPVENAVSDIRIHLLGFRNDVGNYIINVGSAACYLSSEFNTLSSGPWHLYTSSVSVWDYKQSFTQAYSVRPIPDPAPVEGRVSISDPQKDTDQPMNF